jgi:hypothetical protein
MVGNECMKIPFNVLIHVFHLTIGLGMIGHGRVLLGAENGKKFFHVFGHESGVSIVNDLTGESMIVYNLILYYPSESLGVKFQMSCFVLDSFCKPVDNGKDCIIALAFWNRTDKVNGDHIPGL